MKKSKNKAKRESLKVSSIIILFLALIAGLIHLMQPDTLLKLAAVGYFVLATGTVFKFKSAAAFQEIAPKMLMVYALTTIAMFFVLHGELARTHTFGLISKVAELVLVVMLIGRQRAQKQIGKSWTVPSRHHLMSR